VGRYVRAALTSVQKQTFKDWECICIDDGSSDDSAKIVAEFVAGDNRFIMVRQKNSGVSVARNRGMDMARGEYFTFLDPDDVYSPVFLETVFNMAVKHDCDLVQMDIGRVPEIFKLGYKNKLFVQEEEPLTLVRKGNRVLCNWLSDFSTGGLWCYVWRNLYRRATVGHVRFDPGLHPGEDDLWIIKIMEHLKSYAKINDIGIYYRMSRNSVVLSLSRPENLMKNLENRMMALNISCDYMKRLDLCSEYGKMYAGFVRKTFVMLILVVLNTKSRQLFRAFASGMPSANVSMLSNKSPLRDRIMIALFFFGFWGAAQKFTSKRVIR
jgi:glycosyltransferase involved in cell wall biosynthesis